jgi:flagellar basal body-associated protein FliL
MVRRSTHSLVLFVFAISIAFFLPFSAFAQETSATDDEKKETAAGLDETVSIKILAVNPSDARLNTVVTHRLPPEVQPEHIVDKGILELKYDTTLAAYYVTTTINLNARETRALTIKVKNVWKMDMEYIEKVRITLQQTVSALNGTRYQETAERLFEKVNEQLDRIEEEQNAPKGIQEQIELFRSHMKQLKQIENGVMSLSALRKLANQAETGVRTVKFIVRARNPEDERKTMNVRALLPKEITSFDVINKLDFALLFDEDEERFVIEKSDIFDPKEEMKYEIILRDVWYITKDELDFFREQATKIMERFTGTSYENFAQQTIDFIVQTLDDIWILQEEVQESEAIEDRIRAFVINHQRLELVKRKMKELQDLLLEIPVRRMTEVDQIREAINELSKVFDIMSLGFTPDLSTTWWIILGIILFLFVFSATFYVTWVIELGKSKWGKAMKKEKKEKKQKKSPAPESS